MNGWLSVLPLSLGLSLQTARKLADSPVSGASPAARCCYNALFQKRAAAIPIDVCSLV